MVIYADNFGKTKDAYYCHFLPALGVFYKKGDNLNILYDKTKIKGYDYKYIISHKITDVEDILVGNPHRYAIGTYVAVPPGYQIIYGFWGYNYSWHDIVIKKVGIPISLRTSTKYYDLSNILRFNKSITSGYILSYTNMGKVLSRKGKYIFVSLNKNYKKNIFYPGMVILKAEVIDPIKVIKHEVECNLDTNGEQWAYEIVCLQNTGSSAENINILNKEKVLQPGVSRCITRVIDITQGQKQYKTHYNLVNVAPKQECFSLYSNRGLYNNPLYKQVFVFRNDISYNNKWIGVQPGFSAVASSGIGACVKRIGYTKRLNQVSCDFPERVKIVTQENGCVSNNDSSYIDLSIRNLGINLKNAQLIITGEHLIFTIDDRVYKHKIVIPFDLPFNAEKKLKIFFKADDILMSKPKINITVKDKYGDVIHSETKVLEQIEACKPSLQFIGTLHYDCKINKFYFPFKIKYFYKQGAISSKFWNFLLSFKIHDKNTDYKYQISSVKVSRIKINGTELPSSSANIFINNSGSELKLKNPNNRPIDIKSLEIDGNVFLGFTPVPTNKRVSWSGRLVIFKEPVHIQGTNTFPPCGYENITIPSVAPADVPQGFWGCAYKIGSLCQDIDIRKIIGKDGLDFVEPEKIGEAKVKNVDGQYKRLDKPRLGTVGMSLGRLPKKQIVNKLDNLSLYRKTSILNYVFKQTILVLWHCWKPLIKIMIKLGNLGFNIIILYARLFGNIKLGLVVFGLNWTFGLVVLILSVV